MESSLSGLLGYLTSAEERTQYFIFSPLFLKIRRICACFCEAIKNDLLKKVHFSLFNFMLNIENSELWRVCANRFCAQVHWKNRINKITQPVAIGEILPIPSIHLLILYMNN